MKRMIVISLLLVLVAGGAFAAKTKSTPKVDVVFVLDTTGSLGDFRNYVIIIMIVVN